ncbi:MAG: Cof-type HAD-IIB family hydrolase [Longicatena sp.]
MTIKLIALDLDGTLLTSDKTIDEETKKKLIEAAKLGISITIATGRDKGGIDFVYEPLELEHNGRNYVAGVNGQVIYDFHRKEYFVDKVLNGEDAKKVNRLAKKYNFENISCCGYDNYDFISTSLKTLKKLRSLVFGKPMDYGFNQGKRNFIPIDSEEFEITQDINKFVMIQTASFFKKNLPALRKELSEYDILEVGPAWVEIMPKGVSKGSALLRIGKAEGISTDEMMAFGDAENDLEMIKTVKYGIAMGNAMDSLKEAAYDVTDTNDCQGIAKALDKYIFHKEEQ